MTNLAWVQLNSYEKVYMAYMLEWSNSILLNELIKADRIHLVSSEQPIVIGEVLPHGARIITTLPVKFFIKS